ncbi:MAG: hypothetical protein K5756_01595 [Clostridiales bacterium]|nr:hypothetical protein [Clostridiales bacterium]
MKRGTVDYFDGFTELFDVAVRINQAKNVTVEVPELLLLSADRRGSFYKALINEFLPPIERGDILDMINGLHGLNLAAAELEIFRAGQTYDKYEKYKSDMLALTGRAVRELKNFKKPSRLLEYENNIHREYCSLVCKFAGEKHTKTNRDILFRERELREKTKKFCCACERIACLGEQIVSNNV